MEIYKTAKLFVCSILGILYLIKDGLGIECYQCNSKIHPECENLDLLSAEAKKPYETKCWQLESAKTRNYTMCRRIKQDVEGDKSTVRQCATGSGEQTCSRKSGTRKIKMEYCECTTDLCNIASPKLRMSESGLFILVMFAVTTMDFT